MALTLGPHPKTSKRNYGITDKEATKVKMHYSFVKTQDWAKTLWIRTGMLVILMKQVPKKPEGEWMMFQCCEPHSSYNLQTMTDASSVVAGCRSTNIPSYFVVTKIMRKKGSRITILHKWSKNVVNVKPRRCISKGNPFNYRKEIQVNIGLNLDRFLCCTCTDCMNKILMQ